jgi:hypothetical protein
MSPNRNEGAVRQETAAGVFIGATLGRALLGHRGGGRRRRKRRHGETDAPGGDWAMASDMLARGLGMIPRMPR